MTVEIHFILHVDKGIHKIIHNDVIVYVHLFKYCFPKIFSSNSIFQELFNDVLYFSISQIFVDFLICIYCGKLKKNTLKWF